MKGTPSEENQPPKKRKIDTTQDKTISPLTDKQRTQIKALINAIGSGDTNGFKATLNSMRNSSDEEEIKFARFIIESQDKTSGETLLHRAVRKGKAGIVEFLLTDTVVNINTKDLKGQSAYALSLKINNPEINDLFSKYIEKQAKISQANYPYLTDSVVPGGSDSSEKAKLPNDTTVADATCDLVHKVVSRQK